MQINRCFRCMNESTGYPCPHCGYIPPEEVENDQAIVPGTILNGRYLIGCLLGQGGFGMTYMAFDLTLERRVAIKEYFPSGHASRSGAAGYTLHWAGTEIARQMHISGVENILKEARKMAVTNDIPEVVNVRDTFQANDTAYIVMDYIDGDTLKAKIRHDGCLSWNKAQKIFFPAIEAMAQVHEEGLIHRDISPDNIMLTKTGKVRILDLGAAKDLNRNSGASSMLVAKRGFSPVEQYIERGHSGPWTDVYAMAATIYYTLTGKLPQEAMERVSMGDQMDFTFSGIPAQVGEALKHAMAIQPRDRTQDMTTFLKELKGGTTAADSRSEASASELPDAAAPAVQDAAAVSEQTASKNPPAPDTEKKKKSPLLPILLTMALLIAAAGVYFGWHPATEADCTGSSVCRLCGKTLEEATGHNWLAATCEIPRTCSVCGAVEGEASGHSWLDASCETPKTCSVCRMTEGEALGHTWVEATCTSPRNCSTCGITEGTAGHDWQDASCKAPKTCRVCGITEGEPAHSWNQATCVDPYICRLCGIKDGEAQGHIWLEASCTEARICDRCGQKRGDPEGHRWNAADCTEPEICSVCGETNGIVPGHNWLEASCTEPQRCDRCGTTQGDPSGHQWVLGNLLKRCPACGLTEKIIEAGSHITFGSYEQDNDLTNGAEPVEWLVLEVQDGRALVLSVYGLDAIRYNETDQNVRWRDSTLRTWLNEEFLNTAFTG